MKLKFACANHSSMPAVIKVGDVLMCWECYIGKEKCDIRFGRNFYQSTDEKKQKQDGK